MSGGGQNTISQPNNLYDSSITYGQWIQIASTPSLFDEPTVGGKTWAETQQFFAQNPEGLIYKYDDEISYRFLSSSSEIVDPNADNAKLMLILLGAKGIGELAGIISAGAEEAAVQQIQIQAMRYLDNMVKGNTALVFESFITLNKTSNGRDTLTKIGQLYGRIISYANQNCVNLITTMQDWITSFGGN